MDSRASVGHPVDSVPPPDAVPAERSAAPPAPSALAKILAVVATLATLGGLGVFLATRVNEEVAEQADARATQEAAAHASTPEVQVERPVGATFAPSVSFTGTLEPVRAAELGFEAGGRIRSIDVALGETVRAGAVLATLDRAAVGAQSAQTEAAIAMAEAQLAMARDRQQRVEALSRGGAASDADRTGASQAVTLAEAQLAQARAAQRATATASASHVLRAPFAGVVTRVPDAPGSVVGPGVPVFRIEDLASFTLRASVSETDVARLAAGQTAVLDGGRARGTVRTVVRSLDPMTRRAPVEIAVENDGSLVGHALVRGAIEVGDTVEALAVSASAVRADNTVFVVGNDDKIVIQEVDAVLRPDGTAVIRAGVDASSRVVSRPIAGLRAGVAVRIATAPAAPSAAAP